MNFLYFIYRAVISPLKNYLLPASGCKYYPTCSDYARQAVKKYGIARGTSKSLLRFLACNPFVRGGIDLP